MEMILIAGAVTVALLLGAGCLHLLSRLGDKGRRATDALAAAPLLDLVIGYFTIAPLVVGPIVAGWTGLLGGIAGQVLAVLIWTVLHSLAHREACCGPRIVKVVNGIFGPLRNYTALWLTALVVPLFWWARLAEILFYPFLTMLVKLPSYRHGEWINVSRHKFEGLVGHDLIWCLYCDWMTGVWSLGSEMLRNVESFWCPIRFASDKKCEHCRVDFPDVAQGWVDAQGTMADVTALLATKYGTGQQGWFGHPARLTVNGEPWDEKAPTEKPASPLPSEPAPAAVASKGQVCR